MRATSTQKIPELELASLLYRGNNETIAEELRRLAQLVGLDFQVATASNHSIDAVLTFTSHGLAPMMVQARFHDMFASYFARGVAQFHVRDDAADLMALMSAVGATVRGSIIGVIGAHGGAGTTTIAAWLARLAAAEKSPVALADFNMCSDSWNILLGIDDQATNRANIFTTQGVVLPGKLAHSLVLWNGVSILPGNRIAVDSASGEQGSRAVSALSQVHAWTFIDLGVLGGAWAAQREWLKWCDVLILVTHTTPPAVESARKKYRELEEFAHTLIVANEAKAHAQADNVAVSLNYRDVYAVRRMSHANADLDHGVVPGDRKRSTAAKDMRRLWSIVRESVV
ncbi:hypothetical protein JTE88_08450 [Arcanobacterium phocisimile]|uniref:Pilus assembly protein CpaE n=1 Tax=Arcanobacterium phocisimile TaxID=1302235 RepID=A0ABX7IG50_9ACTO|nr:hypothetical protein [Arcanobacterium phocisimile]QRV02089.1 hypothetical protein JTE88_08450 [Arcanobacterium phocisimile]